MPELTPPPLPFPFTRWRRLHPPPCFFSFLSSPSWDKVSDDLLKSEDEKDRAAAEGEDAPPPRVTPASATSRPLITEIVPPTPGAAKKGGAAAPAAAAAPPAPPPVDPNATEAVKRAAAMASMKPAEREWQAGREKEKGDEAFRAREYVAAVEAYSLSIILKVEDP